MRLLITRAGEDGVSLAATITAMGHEPILEPLFTIEPIPAKLPALESFSALIFTSANGVRAFTQACSHRHITAYAVGDRTAEALRRTGFTAVLSAGGDSIALERLICDTHSAADGSLLHIAGTEVAGAIAENLQTAGYQIQRVPLYQASPVSTLSSGAAQMLLQRQLDGVVLFSPRSAAVFETLTIRADLVSAKKKLYAWCLSHAVAEKLRTSEYAEVLVAAKPTQSDLLEMIGTVNRRCISER